MIVLGLGVPWVSTSSGDRWGETAADRAEISNSIKDHQITGIVGLHGDAHMLAYDDGRNNNYATGGGPNFPTFNAAALDRSGSTKGGPYSGGTIAAGGQYGLMSIQDDGGTSIQVTFSGRRHGQGELMGYSFSIPAPAHAPRFQGWRQARLGGLPVLDQADDADPDHDGLSNLVEYAFGLDPLVADHASGLQLGFTDVAGETHLTLSHPRRNDDAQLEYHLEASVDLQTWTPVLFPPAGPAVAAGDDREIITRVDPQPYRLADYRFLRLRVTR